MNHFGVKRRSKLTDFCVCNDDYKQGAGVNDCPVS